MKELKECPCCKTVQPDGDCKSEFARAVNSALRLSVGDLNYDCALYRMTNEQLLWFLQYEGRKAGQAKIKRVLKRRGLKVRQ
ncbi:MAG: hypothetical protein N2491_01785 [Negativicutes bacterium]|nr:hypothetical protein [Negativicutes bacterium]